MVGSDETVDGRAFRSLFVIPQGIIPVVAACTVSGRVHFLARAKEVNMKRTQQLKDTISATKLIQNNNRSKKHKKNLGCGGS